MTKTYVKFAGQDRAWSDCEIRFKPAEGFERCFSVKLRHTVDDAADFIKLLRDKGIACDFDTVEGCVCVLPEREMEVKK